MKMLGIFFLGSFLCLNLLAQDRNRYLIFFIFLIFDCTTSSAQGLIVCDGNSITNIAGFGGYVNIGEVNGVGTQNGFLISISDRDIQAFNGKGSNGFGSNLTINRYGNSNTEGSVIIAPWATNENGYVGIGASSPEAKLHVYSGNAPSSASGLCFDCDLIIEDDDKAYIGFKGGSQGMFFNDDNSSTRAGLWFTDGSDRMHLRAGGQNVMSFLETRLIGINKETPTASLHIKELSAGEEAIRIEDDASANNWALEMGSTALFLIYNNAAKGSFSAISGSYITLSDKRLKKKIQSMEAGVLEKLLRLNPTTYYFKDALNQTVPSNGFIAQEVQKVFPSVVQVSDIDEGYLGINYQELGVLAIKAIQEQHQYIDEKGEKIEQQQLEIDELKIEVKELKELVQTLVKTKRENIQSATIESAKLGQNMPNPFNTSTRIPYAIPQSSTKASIQIHGLNGQLIKSIPINTFGEGTIDLQTNGLSNGQYTYTLEVDGHIVDTKKMNLIK